MRHILCNRGRQPSGDKGSLIRANPSRAIPRSKFIHTASQIKRKQNKKFSLTLRWTAGHTGIQGNEEADTEAKTAAAGRSSDKNLLPPILRHPLALSTSAVKKKHKERLKDAWVKRWRESPREKEYTRWTTPPHHENSPRRSAAPSSPGAPQV